METEERIAREFAKKFGYLPGKAKDLISFLKVVHEFSQYLGANQYYSEGLNKKVFLLNLDADTLVLKTEKLKLSEESIEREMQKSVFRKQKPAITREQIEKLEREEKELEKEIIDIHARALALMEEIRREYRMKSV